MQNFESTKLPILNIC